MINRVNKKIKHIIASDDKSIAGYINGCAQYNGKRLRAKLLLLSHGAFGGVNDKAIELAAIIEIIHLASLLHDDVIDNVGVRRGKKALNILFGNKISILLADYFLAKAMNILCNKEDAAILNIIMETIKIMSKGQLNEIINKNNVGISKDDYYKIINRKTASLFSASCKIGAMLGKSKAKGILAMKKFGANFGMIFQIADDMLDFWGDEEKLGKPVLNDLAQKNFTLPVILLLKEANKSDKMVINSILKSDMDKKQAKIILEFLNKYDIKNKINDIIRGYFNRASENLACIKSSASKRELLAILNDSIERTS